MHDDPGYFGRAIIAQDVNVASDICVMVKAELLDVDEANQEDLAGVCRKIRENGKRIVFDPFAEVDYKGNLTAHTRAQSVIKDPYYNPNLVSEKAVFDLGR